MNEKDLVIQTKQGSYVFNPDQELLNFAKQFSLNYRLFSVGDYKSDGGKYRIHYENERSFSVCHYLDILTLNKFQLENKMYHNDTYTSDFVFYIILWYANFKSTNYDKEINDEIITKWYIKQCSSKESIENIKKAISFLLYTDKRNKKILEILECYSQSAQ